MMMLYVIIVAGLEGTGLHGVARSARRIADAARRCGPVWQGSLAKQDAELGRLRAQLAEKMDRAERHAAQTQRAASVMQARQVGFLQEQWPKRGASLGLVAARQESSCGARWMRYFYSVTAVAGRGSAIDWQKSERTRRSCTL
jgi:hypothetical protein